MRKKIFICLTVILSLTIALTFLGCGKNEQILNLSQLAEKDIAVPTGTMADKLVLSKFANAKIKYFNNITDACLAVKTGKVTAAAYDEPILKNIASKMDGLKVLDDMITYDDYAFAVNKDNIELKQTIDSVINELKESGKYEEMKNRWFPKNANTYELPQPVSNQYTETLYLGTSAVTEPFSFLYQNNTLTGFDIELAQLVADKLQKNLEIVNMDFGALIPSLMSKKVDMIGACITVSEERAQKVLFSTPYYRGGIAAIVKDSSK
ncbi:MAG TPA: transporter substrate-binding domain-containing protein [Candidatus Cloacimonadota bacterium]|nr:transporter substrate-binding domain-containing protein [Candidatus Cloacimonadota bacterium]